MSAVCMLGGVAENEASLYNTDLTDEQADLLKLSLAKGIERLVIQKCNMTRSGAARLGLSLCYPHENFNLRQLDLSSTEMTNSQFRSVMQALRIHPILERLSISHCKIRDVDGHVAMLVSNTSLQHLLACDNNFTLCEAQLARALKRDTSLQTIDLSRTNIGPLVVEAVQAHPSLTSLSLNENNLRQCGEINEALLNCKKLRTLCLRGNPLHHAGLTTFVRSLHFNATLREVNICNVGLNESHVEALCNGLAASGVIALDVSDNQLTDAAGPLLFSTSVLKYIRYLNVANTGLTQVSARHVSHFIEDSEHLSAICLDRTTAVDPISLSDVLTRNRGLPIKALSIGYTGISAEGVEQIVFSMREYIRLQTLVLDGLHIHSASFAAIAELLLTDKSTTRLCQLSVKHNPICDLDIVENCFRKLFERNKRLESIACTGSLLGKDRVERSSYDDVGPVERLFMRSAESGDSLHDERYSPSALFHCVSAVDR